MGSGERFSDGELRKLRTDIDQLARIVEQNTATTQQLELTVAAHVESTAGVVQLYSEVQGAARLGARVQRVLAWLAGMGVTGASIAAALTYVLDGKPPAN